jgi:hypothetical protein
MRTTISFAAATLALALAFGSSADDDAPEPVGVGAGDAPSVVAPSSTPAPGADATAAELARLLPQVGVGFELTPDAAEKGVALPLAIRTGLFGMDPASVEGVALWGVGRVETDAGTAFLAASMVAAGAGNYTFHYVHPTAGGGLAVADMGIHSVVTCGDSQSFRGTVDTDGGLTVFVEHWTEECPDGDEAVKTESMLKMHPRGELELIAG